MLCLKRFYNYSQRLYIRHYMAVISLISASSLFFQNYLFKVTNQNILIINFDKFNLFRIANRRLNKSGLAGLSLEVLVKQDF